MEEKNNKCVMVIDEDLPLGLLANTAGIIGITLGKCVPETVGPTVTDKSRYVHLGITKIPVPILKAGRARIKAIRTQLFDPMFSELTVVDFSDAAQGCKVYDEWIEKAKNTEERDLVYFGLGIYGPKKLVNKITGNLPLLR